MLHPSRRAPRVLATRRRRRRSKLSRTRYLRLRTARRRLRPRSDVPASRLLPIRATVTTRPTWTGRTAKTRRATKRRCANAADTTRSLAASREAHGTPGRPSERSFTPTRPPSATTLLVPFSFLPAVDTFLPSSFVRFISSIFRALVFHFRSFGYLLSRLHVHRSTSITSPLLRHRNRAFV